MLWLWGLGGAFCYGGLKFIKEVRGGADWRGELAELGFAVVLGAIFTAGLTPPLAFRFPWLAQPTPNALALGIGLSANPLSPYIQRIFIGAAKRMGPPK